MPAALRSVLDSAINFSKQRLQLEMIDGFLDLVLID